MTEGKLTNCSTPQKHFIRPLQNESQTLYTHLKLYREVGSNHRPCEYESHATTNWAISAWRHHFSQHQVYDSDFNRTGCVPKLSPDAILATLNLPKESNLHTQIHGQDLQSWTSPIYVVNRHFKNHSNHIVSWVTMCYLLIAFTSINTSYPQPHK